MFFKMLRRKLGSDVDSHQVNGTPASVEAAKRRLGERERRRAALEVELASYPKPRERR